MLPFTSPLPSQIYLPFKIQSVSLLLHEVCLKYFFTVQFRLDTVSVYWESQVAQLNAEELMVLNCGAVEDPWESLRLQGNPTSPSLRRSALSVHCKDWCWSWNYDTLATWCKELTHLKRPWCWEIVKVGGEGDDRGWDSWMASPTRWTWVWVSFRSWWWTGKPGVLWSMGLQRVGPHWATELNWNHQTLAIAKGREPDKMEPQWDTGRQYEGFAVNPNCQ